MDVRKRIFALLMSLAIVLTYMPAIAFADGENPPATDPEVAEDVSEPVEETVDESGIDGQSDETDNAGSPEESVDSTEPVSDNEDQIPESDGDVTEEDNGALGA